MKVYLKLKKLLLERRNTQSFKMKIILIQNVMHLLINNKKIKPNSENNVCEKRIK